MKNDICLPHERAHEGFIPTVADMDCDAVPDLRDIGEMAPVERRERIHDGHPGSQRNQFVSNIAADESEPPRDQNTTIVVRPEIHEPGCCPCSVKPTLSCTT